MVNLALKTPCYLGNKACLWHTGCGWQGGGCIGVREAALLFLHTPLRGALSPRAREATLPLLWVPARGHRPSAAGAPKHQWFRFSCWSATAPRSEHGPHSQSLRPLLLQPCSSNHLGRRHRAASHCESCLQRERQLSLLCALVPCCLGLPGGSDGEESVCSSGDLGLIPGLGRSPGGGHGYRLQYSCWEHPMDRGAWWATVHGVAKSGTRQSDRAQHPVVCFP